MCSVEWKEGNTINTTDTCYGFCMQQVFMDKCGCLNMEHPLAVNQCNQANKSWPNVYCMNRGYLNHDSQQTFQGTLSLLKNFKNVVLNKYVEVAN